MAGKMIVTIAAALLLASAMAAAEAPQDQGATLPGWMAGCWIAERGEGRRSEECWTAPRGTMMLGSGHMFTASQSLGFEHMRIVREEGGLVFIAQPDGAPPTRFTLEPDADGDPAARRLSFVNAGNDYPQRVTYWLADGRLEAEIVQLDGSKPIRWTFRRVGVAD